MPSIKNPEALREAVVAARVCAHQWQADAFVVHNNAHATYLVSPEAYPKSKKWAANCYRVSPAGEVFPVGRYPSFED